MPQDIFRFCCLNLLFIILGFGFGEVSAETPPKNSTESIKVDQLIDVDTTDPLELFRFSPDYVELEPGGSIQFLNSLGKHTVVSIDSMMPEGAEPFEISHQKVAEVKFDKPGVYGIRCRVHVRYGMVMLVKVGDELPNLEKAKKARVGKRANKKFKDLFKQLEADKK